jgi:hypothetical protein
MRHLRQHLDDAHREGAGLLALVCRRDSSRAQQMDQGGETSSRSTSRTADGTVWVAGAGTAVVCCIEPPSGGVPRRPSRLEGGAERR